MILLEYIGARGKHESVEQVPVTNQNWSATGASRWVNERLSHTVRVLGEGYVALKKISEGATENNPPISENQIKILAATRSIIDISAMCFQPYVAVAGVIVFSAKPELSKRACDIANSTINYTWFKLSFEGKIVVAIAAVGASYMWLPVLSTIAALYSLKIGAEITNRNLDSEKKQ